jgi:hypothetical protein
MALSRRLAQGESACFCDRKAAHMSVNQIKAKLRNFPEAELQRRIAAAKG